MNLPTDNERLVILGRTGSGKTQAALWHLSDRNYHQMPWIVYNFKNESLIDTIPGIRSMELNQLPRQPGIYAVHPHPEETQAVEAQMWGVWERGEIGVYVDEGYMIARNNKAFSALLTQGRSKEIPMIVLSQRPAWMNRFVWSETEYIQVFALQNYQDRMKVKEFVPIDAEARLPKYYSYYYDVGEDQLDVVKPVPEIARIHAVFARRLGGRRVAI